MYPCPSVRPDERETEDMGQLPSAKKWNLSSMPAARRAALESASSFYEIAARIRDQASVDASVVDDASDRSAPPRTVRGSFNVRVNAEFVGRFL